MRVVLFVGAALALFGCSNPVRDAEEELEILKKSGASSREICVAARKVADAHLKAKDEAGYKQADLSADINCTRADLDAYSAR